MRTNRKHPELSTYGDQQIYCPRPHSGEPCESVRNLVNQPTEDPVTTATHPPPTAAEQFAARQQSPLQRVQHVLHSHPTISPALVLVLSFIVFSILNPRFAQPSSLSLVFQQVAVVGALAVGQTLVILTAGIDLSVGAV